MDLKLVAKPSSPAILPARFSGQSAIQNPQSKIVMSQHRSLKGASTITTKRNVLKRFERVEVLKKRGQFKLGDRVIGLKKTKPDE